MDIDTLHEIIDSQGPEFTVTIVDEGVTPMKVYKITGVYADEERAVLSMTFDSRE